MKLYVDGFIQDSTCLQVPLISLFYRLLCLLVLFYHGSVLIPNADLNISFRSVFKVKPIEMLLLFLLCCKFALILKTCGFVDFSMFSFHVCFPIFLNTKGCSTFCTFRLLLLSVSVASACLGY